MDHSLVIDASIDPKSPSMPHYEVCFFKNDRTHSLVGKVQFYGGHGGHWASDDRHFHFVAIYDPEDGFLLGLFNLPIIQSVIRLYPEDADGAA